MSNLNLTTNYMPRSRLYDFFDRASERKLVYVIAGAGYGKTQAMHHYIKQQQDDDTVWWVQLTDSDNIASRFWESYTHIAALNDPEMAAKLRELGFPESLVRFKQFAEIITSAEDCYGKTFLVLDDFHLIHSKETLSFVERCAHLQMPGLCVIILSRNEPDINVVSLFSKNEAETISEEELRFTPAETEAFFLKRAMYFSQSDLSQILKTTKGWPFAVNMLAVILKKKPNNLKYALGVMMQNISKLLETEAWGDFSEHTQKMLVKLSLLSDLSAAPLQELLCGTAAEAEFFQNISGLTSFVWFSSLTGDIKIHPLYLEFLRSKHHILPDEETQETYKKAAQWCAANDFHMDAVRYYAKLGRFEDMVKILLSFPVMLPRDTSEYFLEIIENLKPENDEEILPDFLILKNSFIPLLLIGAGRYEDAKNRLLDIIKAWEHTDDPLADVFLYTSYKSLAYIDIYTCTSTHEYNAPVYLEKSVEYFKRISAPLMEITKVFTNVDVRSFACLVGDGAQLHELDEFLETAKKVAFHNGETPYNAYAGYEDLVACEYAYYKNQLDAARNHAHNATFKAQDKKQYSIAMMADSYLLRIAMQEGDPSLVRKILKHMNSYLENPEFSNRQLYYDLYIGAFYALVGFPEMVPQWLVMDEKETISGIRIPTRELFASALYYISAKKYRQALTVLCNSYPREPHERFLFGELKLLILTAIARAKTGDVQGAVEDFEKAYKMSFNGMFEVFFIERGKELQPLTAAALNQENCSIPKEWLRAIERKASIYAKKVAFVANALKKEYGLNESVSLSSREKEVLMDVYHGLSREEIAAKQYLSVNTVKKTMHSIFIKLDANNSVDAVRIAVEKRLIE